MNSLLLQATSVERNELKLQKCSPVRRTEMGREWTSWLHSTNRLCSSHVLGVSGNRLLHSPAPENPIQTQHSAWDTMQPAMELHFSKNQQWYRKKAHAQKEHERDVKILRRDIEDTITINAAALLLCWIMSHIHMDASETAFFVWYNIKKFCKTAPLHFHRASEMKIYFLHPSVTTGNTCVP